MGIHGLWQVLEPTGRPVNINSLRGKVLAVDVSIWLHQLVKGFRDKDGNALPNAHLLGVFHRVCKLLNYGIKPVFVFDGGVPILKRQTLATRKKRKLESLDKAELSRQKILSAYLQQQLQRQAKVALPPSLRMQEKIAQLGRGGKGGSPTKSPKKGKGVIDLARTSRPDDDEVDKDLESFRAALAAKLEDDVDEVEPKYKSQTTSTSDSSDDEVTNQYHYGVDYSENFSVIQAPDFDTLPLETQHEILFEMQESRKMNSWGKFDKMPKDLQSFSSFQMDRLVKRRTLQKKIQSVQQEMGQRHIHVQNLDDLLKMDYNFEKKETQVVGSKEDGFVLIKSQEPKEKGKEEAKESKPGPSRVSSAPEVITIDDFIEDSSEDEITKPTLDDSSTSETKKLFKHNAIKKNHIEEDEEEDLKLAIQLSLMEAEAMKKESESCVSATPEPRESQRKPDASYPLSQSDVGSVPCQKKSILTSASPKNPSKAEVETNEKSEITQESPHAPLESIQSSHMSRCAKFLDTVGFHIPITASGAPSSSTSSAMPLSATTDVVKKDALVEEMVQKVQESGSESDDDFEEVVNDEECINSTQSSFLSCQRQIKMEEDSVGKSETVAIIDLTSITKSATLKKEDDIFADVFCEIESSAEKEKRVAEDDRSAVIPTGGELKNVEVEIEPPSPKDFCMQSNDDITESLEFDHAKWESDDEIETDLIQMVLAESVSTERKLEEDQVLQVEQEVSSKKEETAAKSSETSEVQDTGEPKKMITAEYMQAQEKLNSKLDKLHSEKGQQERIATSISDQMQMETQELISLFGIPYVISPTEAESQCAFLDRSCLTEGSITDDSDVWLFGGQRVYKNFFSQGQKHVEFYQAADIQRVLNLSREKLIALAMLIGSDYSDGIQGVGPVLALEILVEFSSPEIDSFESLIKFRDWWEDIKSKQPDVFSGSKLKEKLRKLNIRPGFPNNAVYDAFMNPSIDTSTEAFKWGNPDLDAIRGYVKQKFGWEQSKCDSFLLPVLKNLRCEAEQSRQLTLDSYISFGKMPSLETGKRKKGSKRMENAMKKLKRVGFEARELNLSSDSDDESKNVSSTPKQKVTNRKLKVGKRNGAPKRRPEESQPESSTCSSTSTGTGKGSSKTPTITIAPKPEIIPQRVQAESDKLKNKQKAIEVFKRKKGN